MDHLYITAAFQDYLTIALNAGGTDSNGVACFWARVKLNGQLIYEAFDYTPWNLRDAAELVKDATSPQNTMRLKAQTQGPDNDAK